MCTPTNNQTWTFSFLLSSCYQHRVGLDFFEFFKDCNDGLYGNIWTSINNFNQSVDSSGFHWHSSRSKERPQFSNNLPLIFQGCRRRAFHHKLILSSSIKFKIANVSVVLRLCSPSRGESSHLYFKKS